MKIVAILPLLCCSEHRSSTGATAHSTISGVFRIGSESCSGIRKTWIDFGDRAAETELTKYSRWTGLFLSVLSPEGACTPERLPCRVAVRFSFRRKGNGSDALHVARFVAESNGRIVEGVAKTDREHFWYWIKRANLWMSIEKDDDVYAAHEEFYVFLMMLTESTRLHEFLEQLHPPEAPKSKGKKGGSLSQTPTSCGRGFLREGKSAHGGARKTGSWHCA